MRILFRTLLRLGLALTGEAYRLGATKKKKNPLS